MKIGIIVSGGTISYSGGVAVQARMWKEGLEQNGDEVVWITSQGYDDWNSFDYIIFVGLGKLLIDYVTNLRRFPHIKFVCAPIIDFPKSVFQFKIRAKFAGSIRWHISNTWHDLYYCKNYFSLYLVRSEYEKAFITQGLGMDENKVIILPLSLRFNGSFPKTDYSHKENFCLHVSRLCSPNKNVARLISAAKKYHFNLKLAGTLNGKEERDWLYNEIGGNKNIEYLGYLSDCDLKKTYERSKVFALPSLMEGVGFVALEAAVYGNEIVLTSLGAPKEYYKGRAYLVDPYNIDDIGKAIYSALNHGKSQPELSHFIYDNYSFEKLSYKLHSILKSIL